jgi:hypothetical protein
VNKTIAMEWEYLLKTNQHQKSEERICANTLEKLDDMGKFLGKHKLLKMTQEEIKNLNNHVTTKHM